MAELTREPAYTIAGTIAPEAYSFAHAGRKWYVHRKVDHKGKAAVRFRDDWQVSTDNVPMTKTVAPTSDHAAKWFVETFEKMVKQMGSEAFDEEIKAVYATNLSHIAVARVKAATG